MTTDDFTRAARAEAEDYARTPRMNVGAVRDRIAKAYLAGAERGREQALAQEPTDAEAWENEAAAALPERYDGDEDQRDIILRAVKDMAARETQEPTDAEWAVRELHRPMPCSPLPAGEDPDTVLLRRAARSERADERHWPADLLTQAADTIDRLRRQHQGQTDHITALRAEVDRLTTTQEPTDAEVHAGRTAAAQSMPAAWWGGTEWRRYVEEILSAARAARRDEEKQDG